MSTIAVIAANVLFNLAFMGTASVFLMLVGTALAIGAITSALQAALARAIATTSTTLALTITRLCGEVTNNDDDRSHQ
jgi:membrane protein implicated in regulation of membrane protease activity